MREPSSGLERTAILIGANSAIARSVIRCLIDDVSIDRVVAISRAGFESGTNGTGKVSEIRSDYSESSISSICSDLAEQDVVITHVILFNGILHNERVRPEKRFEDISAQNLQEVININAITPLLWLAKLAPQLKSNSLCRIAVLSARIGSIEDNRSGGWYAYRSSKAALNMMLRTAAVELNRRAPNVTLIAFHPGTTETALSKPFQKMVPKDQLFEPGFVAQALLTLLDSLDHSGEARFYGWDGQKIPW